MPDKLVGKYQKYTKSNNTKLLKIYKQKRFLSLEDGVNKYLNFLELYS